jgi:hypothetical protein
VTGTVQVPGRSLNYISTASLLQSVRANQLFSLVQNFLLQRGVTMMADEPPTMSTESDTLYLECPQAEGIPNIVSGHIRLILVHPQFYLDIPLKVINLLCLKPRKYLVFLGWCILGVDGNLTESHSSSEDIGLDEDLNEGETYYYITRGHTGKHMKLTIALSNKDLCHAIDLEVVMRRTSVPSEPTSSRNTFRSNLLTRDVRCVFTGTHERCGSGMHIIPYRRGSEVCSTEF